METFKVWVDGERDNAIEVSAANMNIALDLAANEFGYIDHADMAQSLGWTDSKLNVVASPQ